jgi:hypothetical protein
MLAFALHLIRSGEANRVSIYPDGQHALQFDIRGWLERQGFAHQEGVGRTTYGGKYESPLGTRLVVNPASGHTDVVGHGDRGEIIAECKGGIINTRHPGQRSRLYKGLCEAVGMLMAAPAAVIQYAVVPDTPGTERMALRLKPRCSRAGIKIALVSSDGQVRTV